MAADAVAGTLVEKSVDAAAPIGPENKEPLYEALAIASDEARGVAMTPNPFAEKVSGLAMAGVNQIHRQVLGQMDEMGKQLNDFGREDGVGADKAPDQIAPPSRLAGGGSSAPGPDALRNPFAPIPPSGQTPDLPGPARNPFGNGGTTVTYDDPDSGRHYSIPSGQTLYRNPGTGELSVVPETQIRRSTDDDRMDNGQPLCSASGKGLVLPDCEKRRKTRNPFGAK